MAAFEWPALPPQTVAARPGIHNNNGAAYTDVGVFPIASSLAAENTSGSFAFYPYDRIAFATQVGVDWTDKWGAWLYHQNEIRENTGADWPVVHVTTGQQNLLDFGIHTGLYQVWGHDGKAYLCGLYPGANAGEVGAVRYDYETGVWDSWVENVGGKFTACTSCLPYAGRLCLATEGWQYTVDPANRKIARAAGPTGSSDARDKLFTLSDRLFWAGRFAGRLKVYESLGGWQEVADLFALPIAVGGEWALIQDYSRVALVFYSGLRQLGFPAFDTYFSHFSLEAPLTAPLSALSVVDHTLENQAVLLNYSVPIPLATAVVAGGQHESDHNPLNTTDAQFMLAPWDGTGMQPLHRSRSAIRVFPGVDGSMAIVGDNTVVGTISYVSARYGYTDGILSRGERVEPYKVEEDPVVPGGLRIHYAAFTQDGGGIQMSVRIYFRDIATPGITGAAGSPHPLKAATIASTPALIDGYDAPNGTNNVAQKRIDNVPVTVSGSDHYVVWDRLADLGPSFERTPGFQLAMNFPGNLPPL
jgi:hypothetical protein